MAGLTFSGKDSGIKTSINKTSSRAIAVANQTTRFSLYASPRYAPIAGLVTRLAANVADTYKGVYMRDYRNIKIDTRLSSSHFKTK